MKQKKTMLIMVIVLAVLLALYGGLKAWNSHSEKQKKAKEDKEKVSLVDVKSLKSFSYDRCQSSNLFCRALDRTLIQTYPVILIVYPFAIIFGKAHLASAAFIGK